MKKPVDWKFPAAVAVLVAVTGLFAGCTEVERGAHQSFTNANSVIRTGRSKLWGQGEATESSKRSQRGSHHDDEELVQP